MEKLFSELAKTSSSGIDAYSERYLSSVKDVFPIISNPSLLKSHIKTKDFSHSEKLLRFSLVFNDLSLLTLNGGSELGIFMLQPKWFEDRFGSQGASVIISASLLEELGIEADKPEVVPSFVFPRGEIANRTLHELSSFIEKGKLLIQPDRALFYLTNEKTDDGGRQWHGLNVSQFSPLEDWEIVEEQVSRPIPISFESNDHLDQSSMFEITIPYFEGVSFDDLSKILDDEGDLVSGVRQSIKQAISECGDYVDPRIVVKDIIDPKVDALNRKFKSAINSHAFRIAGAAVGTVALAYTAVTTAGISSAVATVCGSGGLGLLGNEFSSYREKINSLKDDPHYFLWRCKNVHKSI